MSSEEKERKEKTERTINKIIDNYKNIEKSLVSQLLLETPNHYLTTGTYREAVWKDLFEQIIPRKFCIAQGVFIIDSHGEISNEVDLAIFDEQYTPYIFNYGKIKFIPIEAVVVVIQCKSSDLRLEELELWVSSIKQLRTSSNSVTRVMMGLIDNNLKKAQDSYNKSKSDEKSKYTKSQTFTRPIKILCSIKKDIISPQINELFDISINIGKGNTLQKTIPKQNENYEYWYEELNHYKTEYPDLVKKDLYLGEKKLTDLIVRGKDGKENVIVSLIFQLNQMLMFINNPIPFPHQAYVGMFNNVLSKLKLEVTE